MRMFKVLASLTTVVLVVITAGIGTGHAVGDAAVVTALDGKAQVFSKGETHGAPVKKNDRLRTGSEVRVGEKSRIELKYPDGTIMRFASGARVRIGDIAYDKKSQSKTVKVDLGTGKMWANVKRLMTSDSRVEVKTVNAVAGVRGTTYQVNVEEDTSAVVKVYDGSVDVSGVQKASPAAPQQPQSLAPVPVPGPTAVPPPYHEVTMEEWHVIVKSFQQVTISPQGVASKPMDFNPQQDLDDWVRWNQERDKQHQ